MREICEFNVSDDEQTSLMLLTDVGGEFGRVWEGLMDDSLMLKHELMKSYIYIYIGSSLIKEDDECPS